LVTSRNRKPVSKPVKVKEPRTRKEGKERKVSGGVF